MAFEAKYQNLFSQQIITSSSSQFITTNSESVKFDQANSVYECNNFVQSGYANPCATSMGLSPLNHEYLDYNNVMTQAQTSIKNSLGLACNLPVVGGQGKRSRDLLAHEFNVPLNNISFPSPTEMQQYLESNCAKKMKVKIAERGKEATRLLIDITKPMIKDLKEQEEKITNLEKLNLALEEKVKTLMVEKQLWKDIANCMNEITGMRCNLDNVMANVSNHPVVAGGLPVVVAQEDAGLGMNITGANYDYGISGMVDVGGELVGQGPILVSKAAEVVGSSGRGRGRGKLRMCKCNKGNHMT